MKRTTIKLASIGISVLFATAVIYLIAGIVSDYNFRTRQTESLFERLVSNISQTAVHYDPFTPEFKSAFLADTESDDQFQTITIDCNGSSLFSPKSSVTASSFIKEYTASFTDQRGNIITISGSLYTLTPELIFNRARLSFLFILAGTIAACILLLFEHLHINSTQNDNDNTYEEMSDTDTVELIDETETSNNPVEQYISDEIPIEELSTAKPETKHGVHGNYAELENTLDSELIQSAASEEDLSLLIVRINGQSLSNDITDKIIDILHRQCGNEAQLFSYKNDGFASILRNSTLDTALLMAETIQKEIQTILSGTAFAGIGIAARTSRLVSGNRLLTEADQAVSHAQEDSDSSIIAFRVNPEKYRQFIAENGDIPDIN